MDDVDELERKEPFRRLHWRVRRHDHVPLLRVRGHASREHWILGVVRQQHDDGRGYRVLAHGLVVYFDCVRVQFDGECVDFLSH